MKYLASLIFGLISIASVPALGQFSTEHLPNYGIAQVWDEINTNFTKIQGAKKRGDTVSTSLFTELLKDFEVLFPTLPQKSNYKVVYDICLVQAQKLSQEVKSLDFDIFVDECQGPITVIMREVNNKHTVQAKALVLPKDGDAPLTVTLDARGSMDPSNDTIPSHNFYWYYKDIKGDDILIGQESVLNYTFEEAGTYIVHLTARSANQESEGIMDGRDMVTVTVAPGIANLVVLANSEKLSPNTYTKIGTAEAERGIIFDGSATLPRGGRKIIYHSRKIEGPKNFRFESDKLNQAPGAINAKLPQLGPYTIELSVTDNENNTIKRSFLLTVADPIAKIEQTPIEINTSSDVKFNGDKSYSVSSRISRYNREVFNEKGDKVPIINAQEKSITNRFDKPGRYTVKLTVTDEFGETNSESKIVSVESTPPQAQFTIGPRLDWKNPSQFVLDAGSSYDVDVIAGFDKLSYKWAFNNSNAAKITQSYDDGKSIVATFDEVGEHTVTLTVTDSFGQKSSLERKINVKSVLRPVLTIVPRAAPRGESINFNVESNIDIINYSRDFGDGTKEITQSARTTHKYKASGIYNVTLSVTDKRGGTNEISTQVFIGTTNAPIGAYRVLNSRNNILTPDQHCDENDDAYLMRRGEQFYIDVSDSVNAKGMKGGLDYYFTPQDDEIYKTEKLSYRFRNLGCKKIDILVEDRQAGNTDKQTIRFNVVNALPVLDSISISFPQFGNTIGVGLQNANANTIFDPLSKNPLVVNVSAQNPRDPDGLISQFVRYYYKSSDPTRILGMKTSPGNIQDRVFSIDTHDASLGGGNIVFGVKIIDNDSGAIMSEDLLGQGPSFFLPPCTTSGLCEQNFDIPEVTLRVNKTFLSVGEKVEFVVDSNIPSGRPDFAENRVIRYDFNGDGVRDIITKDSKIEYEYEEAGDSIIPRVEVTYRKNSVEASGPEIQVKQNLKPSLDFAISDKSVYIRDFSLGAIEQKSICFNTSRDCVENFEDGFVAFTYDDYGEKLIKYEIVDKFGNKAVDTLLVTLTKPTRREKANLVSIPKHTITSDGKYLVKIGNRQNDSVFLNVEYDGSGACFVDLDLDEDSDFDGRPDNDRDLDCNTPSYWTFDAYSDEINGRIIYSNNDGKLVGHGIIFQFTDKNISMTSEQKASYNRLRNFSKTLPEETEDQRYVKALLEEMADNIKIGKNQTETIITLRAFLENNSIGLMSQQLNELNAILDEFQTSDNIAIDGGSIIDQVKQFLIDYAPSDSMKLKIAEYFDIIQGVPEPTASPEVIKTQLSNVLDLFQDNSVSALEIKKAGNENKIIESDIETHILPRICEVLQYYSISSELCPDPNRVPLNLDISSSSSEPGLMKVILKWIGIMVLILAIIFVLIVSFFAIKARIQQQDSE